VNPAGLVLLAIFAFCMGALVALTIAWFVYLFIQRSDDLLASYQIGGLQSLRKNKPHVFQIIFHAVFKEEIASIYREKDVMAEALRLGVGWEAFSPRGEEPPVE
jgi:hypothetical protein